jgi:hypothetical protein
VRVNFGRAHLHRKHDSELPRRETGPRFISAAREQLTKDWWDLQRSKHELFASQFVLDEITAGEPGMARERVKMLRGVPLLEANAPATALGREILRSGPLPVSADGDAAHIAPATVHEMDILLRWNCRHIANVAIHQRLRRLAEQNGYILPSLATPKEFTNDL